MLLNQLMSTDDAVVLLSQSVKYLLLIKNLDDEDSW